MGKTTGEEKNITSNFHDNFTDEILILFLKIGIIWDIDIIYKKY